MARQIIVLNTNPADGGLLTVDVIFWFAVTAGTEVALPSFTSAFSGGSAATKITAGEVSALQTGTVVEEAKSFQFPSGTTAATVKTQLAAAYAARKAWRDAQPNKGQFYGQSWDGSAWTF